MRSVSVILIFLVLIITACKKDSDREYCWQRVDAMGNEMGTVCGKTEAEMKAMDPNACSYYKIVFWNKDNFSSMGCKFSRIF